MSTITYNPLYAVFSEEYSDASYDQREKIIRSQCREGEVVIMTLNKMFAGNILEMEIPELHLSVPCILQTFNELTPDEKSYISSISPYLQIT